MTTATTLTVRLKHNSSIPNARWCEAVQWEPANVIEGAEMVDGTWWDDDSETAGLVWFGQSDEGEIIEANIDDLRVVSCPDCRVIGAVEV